MIAREPVIRVNAMPTDLNPYGGVLGAWIMGQMALGAASLAARHSKGRAIMVAASDLEFPLGMTVGDELSIFATLEKSGRTSMTIATEGWRRERSEEETSLAARGRFTFVAVDENNRPRPLS